VFSHETTHRSKGTDEENDAEDRNRGTEGVSDRRQLRSVCGAVVVHDLSDGMWKDVAAERGDNQKLQSIRSRSVQPCVKGRKQGKGEEGRTKMPTPNRSFSGLAISHSLQYGLCFPASPGLSTLSMRKNSHIEFMFFRYSSTTAFGTKRSTALKETLVMWALVVMMKM
jgi:hypothetical protein